MLKARASRAACLRSSGFCGKGFTMIELMITVAVLAILLSIAVPSFTEQIRAGRAQMASDGLKRMVAKARDVARDSGRRTTLTINGTAIGVAGCDDAAWLISQGDNVIACQTKTDFGKRYEGTSIDSTAKTTVTFLPSGISNGISDDAGNSLTSVSYPLKAGSTIKTVKINAGGVVDVL